MVSVKMRFWAVALTIVAAGACGRAGLEDDERVASGGSSGLDGGFDGGGFGGGGFGGGGFGGGGFGGGGFGGSAGAGSPRGARRRSRSILRVPESLTAPVPETLAGDFRKFWPVPLMVAPGRG